MPVEVVGLPSPQYQNKKPPPGLKSVINQETQETFFLDIYQ